MVHIKTRLRMTVAVLAALLAMGAIATACQPQLTLVRLPISRVAVTRSVQLHPFLTCVRRHESDRGPYPHTRGYRAQNPRSTASGAYQFLNSSWRVLSRRAGFPGYSRAKYAPPAVQDAVAYWTLRNYGKSPWNGTGC
jgi:hypothetical protein